MPLVLADRVNETTTTTSTGTITLAGAVSGYQSFAVIGNGNTTYYTIVHQTANEWEVGIGTYTSSGTTLARNTVLASSNSGSLVNFSAGTKFVFCDYPADPAVSQYDIGTAPNQIPLNQYLGSMAYQSAASVTMGIASIDNLTLTNNPTLSGGTANGVLYLNGSKVATSGSALTFDGTILTSNTGAFTTLGVISSASTAAFSSYVRPANNKNIYFREATAVGGSLTGALIQGATNNAAAWAALSFGATEYEWGISGTERMRLDSSGNLGIGTASPVARLDAAKTSSDTISRTNAVGAFGDYVSLGAGLLLQQTLSSPYGFALQAANAANSVQFPLLLNPSGGNVGIGTSSPAAKLDVNGTIYSRTGGVYTDTLTAYSGSSISVNAGSSNFNVVVNGSERMRLDSSGNLGIGTASPAQKLHVASAGNNYIVSSNTAGSTSALLLGSESGQNTIYSWTTVAGSTGRPLAFYTGASESMRLDTSGNLGLGVTPSAWTSLNVFQLSRGSVAATTGEIDLSHNAFYDGAWKYIANGFATNHYQASGAYVWRTAPSGTAGNAISFTQAMTLDASGNLGVGETSPGGYRLNLKTSAAQGINLNGTGTGGAWMLFANNGTANGYVASAYHVFLGGSQTDFGIRAENNLVLGTGSTERARIDTSGNLLVGTTSAGNARFVVRGPGTTSATASLEGATSGGATRFLVSDDGLCRWYGTSNAETMRLDNAGNLGIGTASPGARLDVQGPFSVESSIRITSPIDGSAATPAGSSFSFRSGSALRETARIASLNRFANFDGGNLVFSTADTSNVLQTRATIDSSGNLGIGTASPGERLDVVGGGLGVGNGTIKTVVSYTTEGLVGTTSNHALLLYANNAERARITSGGNLLVGTTTAGYGLFTAQRVTINPDSDGIVVAPLAENLSAYTVQANNNTGTRYALYIANASNTPVGTISFTSAATAYNTSSDRRLKDNIAPADSAGAVIDAIEVVKHDWKVGGHTRYGMIAQDLHMVAPEAVSVGDADDVEDFKNPWGVDYSKLVPMLVKEVQSLRARLAAAGL